MSKVVKEGDKTVTVTNLQTDKTYKVTPQEAATIKANKLTAHLFRFETADDLPQLGSKIPGSTNA